MMDMVQQFFSPRARAQLVDGVLILSLPGAMNPIVWQMNFEQYGACALEVQEKEGHYVLALKVPGDQDLEIAPFSDKDRAARALVQAGRALEHGRLMKARSCESSQGGFRWRKLIWPVVGLLFLFFLLSAWASLTVVPSGISGAGQGGLDTPAQSGVPMSAEDFLQAR